MIRLLSILAVILFWIAALAAAPIILFLGVVIFVFSVFTVISSFIYEIVYKFLERKRV